MKIDELAQTIAKQVSEQVVTEITALPQLRWIQGQMDAYDYAAWHAQMTQYAQEISRLARDHYGLELTPEQIVVCVSNDCGDRSAYNFAYSLIQDRRHLAAWVASFITDENFS